MRNKAGKSLAAQLVEMRDQQMENERLNLERKAKADMDNLT